MKRFIKHADALADLDSLAAYIGQENPHAAIRFLEAADKAIEFVADMPTLGAIWETDNPLFSGMRFWRIKGYPNHIIFYRPLDEGIEVMRVLYGTRDIGTIFE